MAIYHYTVKIVTRSKLENTLSKSAFRTGKRLIDYRSGKVFDFVGVLPVVTHKIFAPPGSPAWAFDSQDLWSHVEDAENRTNSQLCRDIHATLPVELSTDQAVELAFRFGRWLSDTNHTAVEVSIRRDMELDVYGNKKPKELIGYHTAMMETMRVLGPVGFGRKSIDQKVFPAKACVIEAKRRLLAERVKWGEMANEALACAGFSVRIDHRTLVAQGIDRIPKPYVGKITAIQNRAGVHTAIMEKMIIDHRRQELDRDIERLEKNADELDDLIFQKIQEREDENERVRTTAIAALTADVGTTGGHLQESARLGAADGYFDRVVEQAAATELARRVGERLSTLGALLAGFVPQIALVQSYLEQRIRERQGVLMAKRANFLVALRANIGLSGTVAVDLHRYQGAGVPTFPKKELPTSQISARLQHNIAPALHLLLLRLEPRAKALCLKNQGLDTGRPAKIDLNKPMVAQIAPYSTLKKGSEPSDTLNPTLELGISEPSSRAQHLVLQPIPPDDPDSLNLEAQVDAWIERVIVTMKHPPETVRRASVYIGRVIDRCDGAFAQNLGIDGRYAIHRTPNPPEVGDVVTVEVKADQLIVGVKYRPTLRARR